jgi:hypothetical protein
MPGAVNITSLAHRPSPSAVTESTTLTPTKTSTVLPGRPVPAIVTTSPARTWLGDATHDG